MNSIDNELDNIFFKYKIITYPDILDKLVKDEDVNPINLEINLTNICNHNCIWCTYGYLHTNRDTLNSDVVFKLLEDAKKMDIKSITWTGGGEPTVHKDFFKFIELASKYNIRQGLNTNGACLNNEMIDFIAKNFSYVRFSVDAGTKETLSKCHRTSENDFEKICKNIKLMTEAKKKYNSNVVIGYSFLIDKANFKDIVESTKLAKELGVDYIQIKPIVNYTGSNEQFSEKSEIWKELDLKFEEIKALETENFKVRILNHKFDNIKLQNENYGRKYHKCVGCNVLASVGANGSVDLCCAYKGIDKWSLGNINEESFEKIWYGNKRKKVKEKIIINKCPPMCKADEINRMVDFIKKFDANKEFI